jgi:hypothetical protein
MVYPKKTIKVDPIIRIKCEYPRQKQLQKTLEKAPKGISPKQTVGS